GRRFAARRSAATSRRASTRAATAGISSTILRSRSSSSTSSAVASRSADAPRCPRRGLDQAVLVSEDDGGELRVDVELVQDVLDVVPHRDRGDEELLRDGRGRQSLREAPEDLLLPRGEHDRLPFLRRHGPERLVQVRLVCEVPLERRRLLLLLAQNVDDGR